MMSDDRQKTAIMQKISDRHFDVDGEFDYSEENSEIQFYCTQPVTLSTVDALRCKLEASTVFIEPAGDDPCTTVLTFTGVTFPWNQ